jgi:hypothetical protein
VSDVVVRGDVPAVLRRNMELWVGCVAGALGDQEYVSKLRAAGFEDAAIEVTRVYTVADAQEFLADQSADLQQLAKELDGRFVSGFVRATKPRTAAADAAAPQAAASRGCCGGGGCC